MKKNLTRDAERDVNVRIASGVRKATGSQCPSTEALASGEESCADIDLESSLPYLIARTGARMGQSFAGELKKFGMTLTEWRVCVALLHQPSQRLMDLSAHAAADASTLSRNVDSLIRRGLLQRERSRRDARAVSLGLTPHGLVLTQQIIPLAQRYERAATAGMSTAEMEALRQWLRLIHNNVALLKRRD